MRTQTELTLEFSKPIQEVLTLLQCELPELPRPPTDLIQFQVSPHKKLHEESASHENTRGSVMAVLTSRLWTMDTGGGGMFKLAIRHSHARERVIDTPVTSQQTVLIVVFKAQQTDNCKTETLKGQCSG